MKLWTVQSEDWYNKLKSEGEIICSRSKIPDQTYILPYEWMTAQMQKRLEICYDFESPIWAWALLNGENKRPDLRKIEFKNYKYPSVLLEIEIPGNEVLLSDEEEWCLVMSDMFNGNDEDNWERIFELENPDGIKSRYVQACFGKLTLNQVLSTKVFGKKRAWTSKTRMDDELFL